MRILVSNDDGIHAPGIRALARSIAGMGEVWMVAPDSERSAVGHAITLSDPIKARRIRVEENVEAFAVGGTPADSVKLAVCALMPEPPDLVLSGINLGPNAGIAVIYSGTVSAATEGTILGIPSIAFSLNTFQDPEWDAAARVARDLAERLIGDPLPAGVLLNVNIPNLPYEMIRGFTSTRMAASRFMETFHKRTDPRGNIYYWMDGFLDPEGDPDGTDLKAVAEGWVSLTPVHFDLTHMPSLPRLQAWHRAGLARPDDV